MRSEIGLRAKLLIAALLFVAVAADAQPNCRKGKPCGNSCIARNRTCRIESPSRPPAQPTPAPRPTEVAKPSAAALLAAPAATAAPAADTLLPWVVSAIGATFFASACTGASEVPRDLRMYYRSAENLERLGMSRAPAKREACTKAQMQEHERRIAASVP